MKNWYAIKAQATTEDHVEISIHAAIGSWNVNARDFLNELKFVTAKNITLSMNSPGGSVIDGIAIYNGLRNHAEKTGATITVKVIGIVASISSVIAMAGDKIIMPKNTFMMIHSPSASLDATAVEMREMADLLDKFETSLIATYVARTGKTEDEIKVMLKAETLMTADEAVEMGFADEVTPAFNITASFDLDNLPENIKAVFNSANSEIKTDTPPKTKLEVENNKLFATQILDRAKELDLTDHVETWLLDIELTDMVQVEASMNIASEVRDLCIHAKSPDQITPLIENKSTLAQAREKLCEIRAEKADAKRVDGLQPINNQSPGDVPKAAISTAEIYAARKPKGN